MPVCVVEVRLPALHNQLHAGHLVVCIRRRGLVLPDLHVARRLGLRLGLGVGVGLGLGLGLGVGVGVGSGLGLGLA